MEPVLEDLSDEFRREEGRLKDRRDPREVGLSVSLESAGVFYTYDVRLRVIGGYLSARAEKERPHPAVRSGKKCKAESRQPVTFS